jgi:hypothetical protein
MDTEEPSLVRQTPELSRKQVMKYLHDKYETRDSKDYTFIVKNIARDLKCSPYLVLNCVRFMKDRDIVIILKKRSQRDLWQTNFDGKTKEEVYASLHL